MVRGGSATRRSHCLRWDAAGTGWWLANATAGTLSAWRNDGQLAMQTAFPEEAGAFAQCLSGRLLVCQPKRLCLANGPAAVERRSRRAWRLRSLAVIDPAEPRTSIHEGCTDRSGFFVFGTRNDGADARPIGSFYQYSRRHGVRRLALPAVTVATSICFSADGSRMYFADGAQAIILQCDYDADNAAVSKVREFVRAGALPEGAVIDSGGKLWSAQAGAGRVLQYGADGSVIRQISLPPGGAASLAFGGLRLDQLAVGGTHGLIRIPDPGASGLPCVLFDDG